MTFLVSLLLSEPDGPGYDEDVGVEHAGKQLWPSVNLPPVLAHVRVYAGGDGVPVSG